MLTTFSRTPDSLGTEMITLWGCWSASEYPEQVSVVGPSYSYRGRQTKHRQLDMGGTGVPSGSAYQACVTVSPTLCRAHLIHHCSVTLIEESTGPISRGHYDDGMTTKVVYGGRPESLRKVTGGPATPFSVLKTPSLFCGCFCERANVPHIWRGFPRPGKFPTLLLERHLRRGNRGAPSPHSEDLCGAGNARLPEYEKGLAQPTNTNFASSTASHSVKSK